MIPLTEDRKMLGYELLASYPGISCFVTTRHGGCSQGNYASLNCTPYTGDEAEAVRRNQEIVCSSLPQRPQELVIPFQTHGTKALVIDGTYLHATAEERHSMLQGIDALITREPRPHTRQDACPLWHRGQRSDSLHRPRHLPFRLRGRRRSL